MSECPKMSLTTTKSIPAATILDAAVCLMLWKTILVSLSCQSEHLTFNPGNFFHIKLSVFI